MSSRERFRAWIETTDYLETLQPAAWAAWQARDAEVATLQAEADAWRANARDSGVEARKYKAEVERLVEALREAQDTIDRMADGPHRADWGNMLDKIDAVLREYTPKEKQG